MKTFNAQKIMAAYKNLERYRMKLEYFSEQYKAEQERIYQEESEKLNRLIKEAEKKATARTISVSDILKTLWRIEEKLDIPKKHMDGISVSVDIHADSFPNSYKYTPFSTWFYATYKNGSWRITDISRYGTSQNYKRQVVVEHTEASKKAIIDRSTAFYV